MFASNVAKDCKAKREVDIILMLAFWNEVGYTLKVARVLRVVDNEKKPTMSYVYEAMDRANESIHYWVRSTEMVINTNKYLQSLMVDGRVNYIIHCMQKDIFYSPSSFTKSKDGK